MAKNRRLDFTVVVPVTRESKAIGLLRSIARSSRYCGIAFPSIIFVTDESKVAALRSGSKAPKIITTSNASPASRRNLGTAFSSTRWVLFLDDDVLLSQGFFEEIIRNINHAPAPVIQGVAWSPTNKRSILARLEALHYSRTIRRDWARKKLGQLDPRVLLMTHAVATQFPFDERLNFGGEGHELLHRLVSASIPVQLNRRLRVSHYHRTSIKGVLQQRYRYGQGRAQMLRLGNHRWRERDLITHYLKRHFVWTTRIWITRHITWTEWFYSITLYCSFWIGFLVASFRGAARRISGSFLAIIISPRRTRAAQRPTASLSFSSPLTSSRVAVATSSKFGTLVSIADTPVPIGDSKVLFWADVRVACEALADAWGRQSVQLAYFDAPYRFADCYPISHNRFSYIEWIEERLRACEPLLNNGGSLWIHTRPNMLNAIAGICKKVLVRHPHALTISWMLNRPAHLSRTGDKYGMLLVFGRIWVNDPLPPLIATGPSPIHDYAETGLGSASILWDDIPLTFVNAPEMSYWLAPVKPRALIRRIIDLGSRKGDKILDCFCGTGITAEVAQASGRQWASCDTKISCIEFAVRRLHNMKVSSPHEANSKWPIFCSGVCTPNTS